MSAEPEGARPEIVIIRRRSGGDGDSHHGGAWKIAYADFVTAMMAFFLVMWLINASNEATRAQVASYFNPVKLTDSSTSRRGLNDPKETFKQKQGHGDAPAVSAEAEVKAAEDRLLENPVKTLDAVVAAAPVAPPQPPAPPAPAAPGEALRDPFDPLAWKAEPHKPDLPETARPQEPAAMPVQPAKPAPPAAPPPAKKAEAGQPREAAAEAEAVRRQAEAIRAEIIAKFGAGEAALPANLDVKPVNEGFLISLTDRHEFGMFALGSAEPDARLVALVAAIAAALGDRQGFVVIRGHTDSRPYHNRKYDNWQLSTARAHMAYYMLLRGGLDEARVRRIEGYADRDPRDPAHPEAESNRRIDILLGGTLP